METCLKDEKNQLKKYHYFGLKFLHIIGGIYF
jgi:hypothetical protein